MVLKQANYHAARLQGIEYETKFMMSLRGVRFFACHCEANEVSRSNLKTGSEQALQSQRKDCHASLAMTMETLNKLQVTINLNREGFWR